MLNIENQIQISVPWSSKTQKLKILLSSKVLHFFFFVTRYIQIVYLFNIMLVLDVSTVNRRASLIVVPCL